ncbi:MAG TPA: V-type ATPase 116kDa subunit family protein, partial [Synergistaceae bacterium]|nr:V-type ATPase 116kDa subunit family protein [Synergistaceae bacterium]
MTVAAVSKIGLAVHKESERAVLAALQSFGLCEIVAPREEDAENRDQRQKTFAYGFDVDASSGDARYALRVLEPYYQDSGDLLSRMLELPERNSVAQLRRTYEDFPLQSLVETLRQKERLLAENRSEYSRSELFQSVLDSLLSFPHELSLITRGTEYVRGVLGTLPGDNVAKAEEGLRSVSSYSEAYAYDYGDSKNEKLFVALFPRENGESATEVLIKLGFVRMDLPQEYVSHAEPEKEKLLRKLEDLRSQEESLLEEFRSLAAEHVEPLRKAVDYLGVLKSRDEVSENAASTERTKYFSLWCPKSELPLLLKTLEKFEKEIDLVADLPTEEGEIPPTILKNPRWAHPYEPLTNLYGAPGYGGIDPTVFFAPFFFLFFGMCLSDGGYGLVFACIFLWIFHTYRVEGEKRKFFSLLFWG